MNGDFKTDITRDSFHRRKNFSRVLMQQGRVQLDADWNEQNDILLHYMRTLAHDIIGPHAGPRNDVGFAIELLPASTTSTSGSARQGTRQRGGRGGKTSKQATDQTENAYQVNIKRGRYYVDGILCEADRDVVYTLEDEQQPPPSKQSGTSTSTEDKSTFLFYLDVWEREVTYLEDDSIREVALNGADTATRAQVIYQIRTQNIANLGDFQQPSQDTIKDATLLGQFVTKLTNSLRGVAPDFLPDAVGRPLLKARTLEIADDEQTDPCIIPPTSQYRGAENQLYRVEVHSPGYGILPSSGQPKAAQSTQRSQQSKGTSQRGAATATGTTQTQYATFKWSRENGSVTFPIVGQIPPASTGDITVTLVGLGRDDSRFALNTDDWVEIVDYEDTLELEAGQLMRVKAVDYVNSAVTLTTAANQNPAAFDTDSDPNKPQLLRRWDYTEMDPTEKGATTLASDGGLEIIENHWLTLEDGIQVLFHRDIDQQSDKDADDQPPYYHTGDYWLIPARAVTGQIEWPSHKEEHEALPPHGIVHHYAPLAYVAFDAKGVAGTPIDLRREIEPIWQQVPQPVQTGQASQSSQTGQAEQPKP